MNSAFTITVDDQGNLVISKNRMVYIGITVFMVLFFIMWYSILIGGFFMGFGSIFEEGFNPVMIFLAVFLIAPLFFIGAALPMIKIAFFGEVFTLDRSMRVILKNNKEIGALRDVEKVEIRSKLHSGSRSYSSSTTFDVILVKSDYKDISLASSTEQSEIFALGRQVSDFIGCALEEKV